MLKAPCKDCSDRRVGCHSVCEKYLAYDMDRKSFLEKRSKILQMEYEVYQTRYSKRRKMRK